MTCLKPLSEPLQEGRSSRSSSTCCSLTPLPIPSGSSGDAAAGVAWQLGVCPLPGVLHVLVLTSAPSPSPPSSCSGGASPSTVKAGGKETGPSSACLVSASWQLTLSVALPCRFTQHLLGAQVCPLHLSGNDSNSSSFLTAVTQCCASVYRR